MGNNTSAKSTDLGGSGAARGSNEQLNSDDAAVNTDCCKRVDSHPDDLAVRTFAGVVVEVNISLMDYRAEATQSEFAKLLDEALEVVEQGLIINKAGQ